jgi:transcriptional regulator with GAF, ATPase, and Fis domain
VIESAAVFRRLEGLPLEAQDESWPTLDEHQRNYIQRVLRHCRGVIEGQNGAAELLGLAPSTLRSRMKRLNIPANFGRPSQGSND